MDEQLVLTAQTLRLNPDLQKAEAPGNVIVLKNIPGRKYLVVSGEQWNLLRIFANPATVPDVLRAVILNRTCLPLREYYELILKSHRTGILQSTRDVVSPGRASRWALSLPAWTMSILGAASTLAAALVFVLRPMPLVPSSSDELAQSLVIGWLLLSLGLSIGQVLAASVLRGGGGEIYEPRFRLLRPVPYFGIRLDDTCMMPRAVQCGVWGARLFPVMATAALLWFYKPEWGLLHVVAAIVMLRPVGRGCLPELFSILCRGLVLDTQRNLVFSLNRRWKVRLRVGLGRLSGAYLAARLIWAVAWVGMLMFVLLRAFHQSFSNMFGTVGYWREVGLVFAAIAAAAVLGYLGLPIGRALWTTAAANYRTFRKGWRRRRMSSNQAGIEELISRTLAESLLFRRLPPAERAELRQTGEVRTFKSWKNIQRFHDPNLGVGVILSGKLVVYRQTKSGRAEKSLTLSEGDVFGAHALIDAERQQVRIRTLTPVVALMFPTAEFERRVVRPMGAPLLNDLIHKVPFLRSVSFCASWHPQALARFAQLCSTVGFHDGELIVADRQDTQQFYVVYEGQVAVRRQNRIRARLKPGSFFGEVSILQNSSAVSDVVATEPTRCLMISKADFLRFVTHNPFVSLQLEQISSKRLGRPIFPLSAHSFEIR